MGPEDDWFDSNSPDSYKLDKGCTVAPNTLSACTWVLPMGDDVIRGKVWENKLYVILEPGRMSVTIDYHKGVHGLETREHMSVQEAIEWLNLIQREWSHYGSQIGSQIDGLRKYQR